MSFSSFSAGTGVYLQCGDLQVDRALVDFVQQQALPGTGLEATAFWQGFSTLVADLAPKNAALLQRREQLQAQIDAWHIAQRGKPFDAAAYQPFLLDIGYLVADTEPFSITTANVDAEIASLAGPQLVVPVMNARFALNACNARWGSLYDALYGTDVISDDGGAEAGKAYNPVRGAKVIDYGRDFLDRHFALAAGSFFELKGFRVENGELVVLLVQGETRLANRQQWCGYVGDASHPSAILLVNHGLHVEVQIDRTSTIGANDLAGIKDLVLEAALTTIMDCEDSVAAVDAEDKVLVYKNWLGLMQGTLEETMTKNGQTFVRRMAPDRQYINPQGQAFGLPGRSLMFVRNVGHLMTTPAILDAHGKEIPEGIMDGVITSLAALHDLNRGAGAAVQNSRTGSIYIVKPKMHGPEEVAFCDELFERIELLLGLPVNTLKIGIMDEERRTTVNLKACIRAAKARVAFINTGFLDRTGDEIHTSMEAGAFASKDTLKTLPWIGAYELHNVATGLACGLQGKAQIGKGMWAMPDNMAAMMAAKISQPKAGANTAWVPSPTAATLHAMHYHAVDVAAVQAQLPHNAKAHLANILSIPLMAEGQTPSAEEIEYNLDNNAQGILGYVVRWVDQGIGCSKVPDINNTALMEDRATLRISSQHLSNWLHHGICTQAQVMAALTKMAKVVDAQNASDPNYQPMALDLANNLAFAAAKDLIFKGRSQPSGYTEPLLHAYRHRAKI